MDTTQTSTTTVEAHECCYLGTADQPPVDCPQPAVVVIGGTDPYDVTYGCGHHAPLLVGDDTKWIAPLPEVPLPGSQGRAADMLTGVAARALIAADLVGELGLTTGSASETTSLHGLSRIDFDKLVTATGAVESFYEETPNGGHLFWSARARIGAARVEFVAYTREAPVTQPGA